MGGRVGVPLVPALGGAQLARRRSLTRAIWIASSNSSTSAIASASIEIGSWPGVATAANTNSPKISPRRHALSLA